MYIAPININLTGENKTTKGGLFSRKPDPTLFQ